jgi:hypothetical protein
MKRIFLSAAIIATIFTACEKEAMQPQNSADASVQIPQKSDALYLYRGKEVTLAFLNSLTTENHWLVIKNKGSYTYNVFDTEQELQNFAKTTSYASVFAEKFAKVEAARAYAAAHNSIASYESTGTVPADYTEYLAKVTGVSKTAGVGVLFDDLNGSGAIFPISGNPQATLPGFDNRAESAGGIGLANSVWDKTFFRGSSRYLLLGTGQDVVNFDGLGFQNVTSSCW